MLGLTALVLVTEAYPQSRYEPAPVYRPLYEKEQPEYRPRLVQPQIEERQGGGYGKPKYGRVKIQVSLSSDRETLLTPTVAILSCLSVQSYFFI